MSIPGGAQVQTDSSDSLATSRRISGLDGLRAFAIAFVILGHARHIRGGEPIDHFLGAWDPAGYGVQVFFTLSGYLITTLLLRERRIDLAAFYVRRAYRILPAAVTYLIIVAAFVPLRDVATALFFVRNLERSGSALTAHYWSLSVEEQFYLVWPALLAFAPRRARLPAALAWLCVLPVWQHFTFVNGSPTILGNGLRADLQSGGIATGCALALLGPRISARAGSVVLLAGVLACPISAALGSGHGRAILASYLLNAGLGAVVLGAASGGVRWLDAGPLRWFGRLSFSLYLWQQPWVSPAASSLPSWPLGLLPALVCSMASYYFVERPMLKVRDARRVAEPPLARLPQDASGHHPAEG
jgi:peptidoglycan/LPS O-acetylase OafA/YrhL